MFAVIMFWMGGVFIGLSFGYSLGQFIERRKFNRMVDKSGIKL